MTHAIDAGLVATLASWVLHVVLGVWVLTLKPRRTQTLLLAAYFLLHGMGHILEDLGTVWDLAWGPLGDPRRHLLYDVGAGLELLGHLSILALTAYVPRRLEDRGSLVAALGIAGVFTAGMMGALFLTSPSEVYLQLSFVSAEAVTLWAAALLLAFRAAPSRDPTAGETTQLAILAVAFAFVWEFVAGGALPGLAESLAMGDPATSAFLGGLFAFWLMVAGLWGWNMVNAPVETVPLHRAALLAILLLLLAGAMSSIAIPQAYQGVVFGIVNTIGVALIAYGVLRHDLAGLDAKVRFGVSKTTLAGVFIAVFFIVSEGAQAVFADFAGNELLGVIAAGALVFFLAPLQRLADRVATKAVPGGAEPGADAEERYRREVEMALADGQITRAEERQLAKRATQLGIEAQRAFDLREQAEEELGGEAT